MRGDLEEERKLALQEDEEMGSAGSGLARSETMASLYRVRWL